DDLLGGDAGSNHRRAHGLAARDDPVGKPIDEGMPDGDRHVPAAYDRAPEGFRREAAEPAVDGAMGVDGAHPALPDQPTQTEERGEGDGGWDRDRLDWKGRGARLTEQQAIGLARDERVPAVADQPAGFGEGADLLAAAPERRLGVQEGRHGGRLPP